jgi:spore maturation protein CgeB
VCSSASIVLGRDWTDACQWYFSNRTWFTLGCGGFLLTNFVPGLGDIFGNHRELVWYRSPEECFELVAHYLARPEERRRIAAAGRAFALAHRTYDHFARDLLALLDGKPSGFPPRRAGEAASGA